MTAPLTLTTLLYTQAQLSCHILQRHCSNHHPFQKVRTLNSFKISYSVTMAGMENMENFPPPKDQATTAGIHVGDQHRTA